jgi:hypothetical protein
MVADPSFASENTQSVRALAEELTRVVGVARALLLADRDIDLTGLESQVGLLCAKTLDLPPEEGRRLRPWLVALSGAVEGLWQVFDARGAPAH